MPCCAILSSFFSSYICRANFNDSIITQSFFDQIYDENDQLSIFRARSFQRREPLRSTFLVFVSVLFLHSYVVLLSFFCCSPVSATRSLLTFHIFYVSLLNSLIFLHLYSAFLCFAQLHSVFSHFRSASLSFPVFTTICLNVLSTFNHFNLGNQRLRSESELRILRGFNESPQYLKCLSESLTESEQ